MSAAGNDISVKFDNLSVNDYSERAGEISHGTGSESESSPGDSFRKLIERLTCGRIDYVHDYPQLDSVKFAIGESLFIKNSPILTLYAPILQFPGPKAWSTVAILDRGPSFSPLQAVSGWGHKDDSGLSRISGRLWTEQVFLVSEYVGHALAPDDARDQGRPGWFNASHAEKQVLAFLLRYHTTFKDEWGRNGWNIIRKSSNALQALAESKKREVLSLDEYDGARSIIMNVLEEEDSLRDILAKNQVVPLQKAEVFLSKEEHCTDCEAFFEIVKNFFKLNLVVHMCQTFKDSKRPI